MPDWPAQQLAALMLVVVLASVHAVPLAARAQTLELPFGEKVGPYIDKVVYTVVEGSDAQVLALQNNEVDLIGDAVDPSYLSALEAVENIETARLLRNGYGYVTLNTVKNPLNYTLFRRALAFALDKEAISRDVWDGLSEPLDSCVPKVNPFSCEGHLPYTYYEGNVELGNRLLDEAGFEIDPVTGFRNDPHGNPFDVKVECPESSQIAIGVGQEVVDALEALSVDAELLTVDFYELINRLYFHGNYDIAFSTMTLTTFDVDWLAYQFWAESTYEPSQNFPNWDNVTYNSYRAQLLHATDYQDVYDAAFAMQEIWVHACPMIVCYENAIVSAYRTDRFEGFVNDVVTGVPNYWTNYKVHLRADQEGAPFGGTFRWATATDVGTFNFMVLAGALSYPSPVLQMLYDSLLRMGPDGRDMPWLAESYVIETHADNPAVPEGNTRLTFHLVDNATWTDGQPLTAEDVAFSMNYYRDSPGNPLAAGLEDIVAAYAQDSDTVVMEFTSESYWHLHSVAYKNIIPKHVFTQIPPENWSTWNPQPPAEPMVTSGPFNVSGYVQGNYCELTYNPEYCFAPHRSWPPPGPDTATTTTTVTTTTTTPTTTDTTAPTTPGTDNTTSPDTTPPTGNTTFTVHPTVYGAIIAAEAGAAVVIVVYSRFLRREQ